MCLAIAINEIEFQEPPFETMYPECIEFDEIYDKFSNVSLETFNNFDSGNQSQYFNEEKIETRENNYSNLIENDRRKKKKTSSKLTNTHVKTVEVSVNTDCTSRTCLKNI
ncbi:uncharacterized protein LOC127288493 [Leptopilina boulardi]|uniref:uncharacterized protein LOC127288493 n=1 Tax=Leptopilina boulardi TaxID=63433 RepID=UPI0021F65121|nr:uncharacterized protein LOC127288493 [Leptopilina boulardi]